MSPSRGTAALAAPEEGAEQVVVVEIGQAAFGLPIDLVREVVHVPPITRLPFPPPSVPGVVSVRGVVLPILDLGDRLFGTPSRRDGRLVIVADPDGRSELALLVDDVCELTTLDRDAGEEAPPEIEASLPEGFLAHVAGTAAGRIVALLDLEMVLARTDTPEGAR